jgi:hypothetical protein
VHHRVRCIFLFAVLLALSAPALAANLVSNPNFDVGTTHWNAFAGTFSFSAADGFPAPGAVRVLAPDGNSTGSAYSDCIAVDDTLHYDFSAMVKVNDGANGGYVALNLYTDAACNSFSDYGLALVVGAAHPGRWIVYSLFDGALPSGTKSVIVNLIANGDDGGVPVDLSFDTIRFGPTEGSWQPLNHQPAFPDIVDPSTNNDLSPGGAAAPMLLTDGSVIFQNTNNFNPDESFSDGKIFKLTPDINGSYLNGTWSQLATMPYVSIAAAQAVLPDGRVLIEGGEFSGYYGDFTLTNQGAIYDPVLDSWTSVAPPPFFVDLYPPRATFAPNPIGDSSSVVLPDGTFMLHDKMSRQAALLDLQTMTWTETGTATKADLNDEEGWTLLPNGKVLTVDCYTDFHFGLAPSYPADPTGSEIYDPATTMWTSAGSTINTLTDPVLSETGPAILRPDGTVFAVGSQGYTSIFASATGTWTAGPRLPMSPQGYQYTAQDGSAALLPNGHVLFGVTGGAADPNLGGYSDPPVAFFEFDGQQLTQRPTIPDAANQFGFNVSLLVLPTGQILEADATGDVEIYTPADTAYNSAWAPVIGSAPAVVVPGGSYTLGGTRFNGMSQGSAFGDELQNATNYPLLRITNLATQHVFYSRTHDHSSMAVASNLPVSTHFDVPMAQELGDSKLEVVANGIPSGPIFITVKSDEIFTGDFDAP